MKQYVELFVFSEDMEKILLSEREGLLGGLKYESRADESNIKLASEGAKNLTNIEVEPSAWMYLGEKIEKDNTTYYYATTSSMEEVRSTQNQVIRIGPYSALFPGIPSVDGVNVIDFAIRKFRDNNKLKFSIHETA
jgi:hypothetical protein